MLFRLVHDREVQLYDGSRLIQHEKYDELLKNGSSEKELLDKKVYRVHPSFRIIALAQSPAGITLKLNFSTSAKASNHIFGYICYICS